MAARVRGRRRASPPPAADARTPAAPPTGLARAASLLLVAMAIVCAVGVGASLQRMVLYQRVLDLSPDVTRADLLDSEKWVIGAYVAVILGQVPTGVVFIRWQHRHALAARRLGGPGRLGPGWAIGGWFVPVASAVLPGVELFGSSRAAAGTVPDQRAAPDDRSVPDDPPAPDDRATPDDSPAPDDRATPDNSPAPDDRSAPDHRPASGGRGSRLVPLWMAAFSVGMAITLVAGQVMRPVLSPPFESPGAVRDARLSNQVGALGFAVLTVAAVLAAVMVRALTRRQVERAAAVAAEAAGAAAADRRH